MSSVARKIFKSFTQMFAGSGVNFISSLVSGYFFALFLGPAVYGIWQTARVFLSYSTFTSLGIPFTMRRDFVTLRSEGKMAEADKLAHVTISYSFIVNPAVGLIFILIALFSDSQLALRISFLVVGILYITELFTGIGNILHKGLNDYRTIALGDTIYGIGLLLLIPLVYWFGYYALLAGYLSVSVVRAAFFFSRRPVKYKWDLDIPVLRKLIFSAFPLFMVSIISTVFISVDRLLIAGLLDFSNVGYYSLSTIIAQPLTLMVASLSVVIFTHLNEQYGSRKDNMVIERQTYIPQRLFSDLIAPVIGIGIVVLPQLTDILLPKYSAGVLAAQINIFAILFLKLATFSSGGLFILDKHKYTAVSFFLAGILKTAGSWWALKAGYGIEAVAVFTLLAYLFYHILMLYFVNRSLGNKPAVFLNRIQESLLCPAVIMAASLLFIRFSPVIFESLNVVNPWLQILMGIGFMLMAGTLFAVKSLKEIVKILKKR